MKYRIDKILILLLAIMLPLLLVSCEGSGGPGSPAATGTLDLKLTDNTTNRFQAVYVTIKEVHVHNETDGWEILAAPDLDLPQTFNLLDLVNGVMADLGLVELAAGHYNQMRLILDDEKPEMHPYANYLVDPQDMAIELQVPSGNQTGIKLVNGFDIAAGGATELVLDFDCARSLVQAGKSGKWLLKPTIKVLETLDNSVSGTVEAGGAPVGDAFVSAQVSDPTASDPKDEVSVEATTETNAAGAYLFYLPPDLYNIVVTMDGYLPACQEVDAQYYEELAGVDFSLVPETEPPVTITVNVSNLGATDDGSARLSIRQTLDCGAGDVVIEAASMMVAEDGSYSFILPAGSYTLVASTAGKETQVVENIDPAAGVNIVF